MKCCHCGKEIKLNDNTYYFCGGLGNKKLGTCCSECSKLLKDDLLKLRSSMDKYNTAKKFCSR
ncbi:protein of unknown function [Ruminococcaceae bacterium BL-6]|nr:protein of unknown function [Ruminococcaceae bacterium BL-6]